MNTPARLNKKLTLSERVDEWAWNHSFIILSFCFISGGILFICLAYTIVGVSATESGALRNFLVRGL